MAQKRIADITLISLENVDFINCPLGVLSYNGLGDFEIYNPNIENKRDIEEELNFELFVDEDEEIDEDIINQYIDEISNYGMEVKSFEIKEGVLFKFDASFNKEKSDIGENKFIVDINKINSSGLVLNDTFKEISFESESLALLALERINKLNTNSKGLMNDVINTVRDLTDSQSLIESLEEIQGDRKDNYSKDIGLDNNVETIYISSDLSKPFIQCELNEFGVSGHGDSTFKDFLDEEFKFLTKAEYAVVYDVFTKETYSKNWVEIDNGFYMEKLEVLPPRNHSTINNVEFFQSSERELGNITATFAKVRDKTFKSYQETTVDFCKLGKELMDLYINKLNNSENINKLNSLEINSLLEKWGLPNYRDGDTDFDGGHFSGAFDSKLLELGYVRFAVERIKEPDLTHVENMLIIKKDLLDDLIKSHYSYETMYECEKSYFSEEKAEYRDLLESYFEIYEPIIKDLGLDIKNISMYVDGIDYILDKSEKLGYVFSEDDGFKKIDVIKELETSKSEISNLPDSFENEDYSEDDFNEAMSEFSKVDKIFEQRLG